MPYRGSVGSEMCAPGFLYARPLNEVITLGLDSDAFYCNSNGTIDFNALRMTTGKMNI